eukprot:SAG31_NODE_5700_length_2373_cov_3.526385_2_plen_105_part_00
MHKHPKVAPSRQPACATSALESRPHARKQQDKRAVRRPERQHSQGVAAGRGGGEVASRVWQASVAHRIWSWVSATKPAMSPDTCVLYKDLQAHWQPSETPAQQS